MEDKKVSIITVCLNSERTIEQTIQSVIHQTYHNIEYIIIDGKSTDRTLEIIEKYKARIAKCISEEDNGLYDAMNKGIELATGDIIGIINSDDWYADDAVENVVRAFETEESDVVYGMMEVVHTGGSISKIKNGELQQMLYRMVIPHPTAFVKKTVYEKVGKFDMRYKIVADYDLFLRMYLYPVKMQQIPYVLAFFREGGLSTANAVTCAEEVRAVAKYYARQRENFEILEEIERYYEIRIQNAKTLEKAYWILKNNKKKAKTALNEWLEKKQKVNIFGAGSVGVECFQFLKEMDVSIECFWDNDEAKYQTMFLGKPVLKCIEKERTKNYIVVAVMNYQEEIVQQLEAMGYQRKEDFCLYSDIIENVYMQIEHM